LRAKERGYLKCPVISGFRKVPAFEDPLIGVHKRKSHEFEQGSWLTGGMRIRSPSLQFSFKIPLVSTGLSFII